jgi:hypothetical protein
MKKRMTYWFVEPLDSFTNEQMAKFLASTNDLVESLKVKLADGTTRSVFQLPDYQSVSKFNSARDQFGFKYKIYRRQGLNGQLVLWPFNNKKQAKA